MSLISMNLRMASYSYLKVYEQGLDSLLGSQMAECQDRRIMTEHMSGDTLFAC